MKSADGIDIANQALKYGDYLEYLGGSNAIIRVPKNERGAEEKQRCGWKNGRDIAGFEDGGKGP